MVLKMKNQKEIGDCNIKIGVIVFLVVKDSKPKHYAVPNPALDMQYV